MTDPEVLQWIQTQDDDPMVVSVSDPEFKKSGLFGLGQKKTLFVVRASSRLALTSVSRQYKDFALLHKTLVDRFHGACIPPVPPEKIMGATKEDFVTKRMHLLEYFLQAIVDNPFLRNDASFDIFINNTDAYDKATKAFDDKKTESVGLQNWKKALASAEVPEDPEKLLSDVGKELDIILKSLSTLKAATKSQIVAQSKLAETSRVLTAAFETWEAREEANISSLRGVMVRPDGSKAVLAHELKGIVRSTGAVASVLELEYGATQMENVVLDAVRFEIAQAERWKETVIECQSKVKENAKAAEAVKSYQMQLGSISTKPNHTEKQMTQLTEKLAEAKQKQTSTSQESGGFQKGLLVIELERYRKQRTTRVETMRALLVKTHIRGANMIKCAWDGTGVDLQVAQASTAGGVMGGSFFRKKSITRTASGRLKVNGALSGLEEELNREANTMAVPRDMAIHADDNKVTLKAKRDYVAKKKDELDLMAGETVTAVRIDDDLWYATNSKGVSGLVPSSYVGVPPKEGMVERPKSLIFNSYSSSSSYDGEHGVVLVPPPMVATDGMPMPPAPIMPSQSMSTSAPPGMAPSLPPGVPPLPPPSRDPEFAPVLPDAGSAPPIPPALPDWLTKRGSVVFNQDVPPLPKNVEQLAALKAKLQQLTN